MHFTSRISQIVAFLLITTSLFAQEPQYGDASYYSDELHGRPTSSGEIYDKDKLTCAHKSLPTGSIIKVTRIDNGASVRVRVNDCGPHVKNRIVDLSRQAAEQINLVWDGVTRVRIDLIKKGTGLSPCKEGKSTPVAYGNDEFTTRGVGEPGEPQAPGEPEQVQDESLMPPPFTGTFHSEGLRPLVFGFAVQIASFTKFQNTAVRVEELEAQGYENVLVNTDGENFRILIGPFDTEASADAYKKNLAEKRKIKGFVVDLSDF